MRAFQALSEELHFGRAAARLEMSRTALSESIRRLEAGLGVVLFERSTRRVVPTEAGRVLAPRVTDIINRVEGLSALPAKPRRRHDLLRVAVISTGFGRYNRLILGTFAKRHPRVRLTLHALPGTGGPSVFLAGGFDVALIHLPYCDDRIVTRTISQEERYIMLPAGHRLAGAKAMPFGEFIEERFCATVPEVPAMMDYWLANEYREQPPVIGGYARNASDLICQVAYGGLVATVPRSTRSLNHEGIAFVQVSDIDPCDLGVAAPADEPHPLFDAFVQAARDAYMSHE